MTDTNAEQIAALEREFARLTTLAAATRTQMLSDRLTRSRKESQMREAVIEEAEDQARYFEGRTREMEQRVHIDESHLAALEAQAAAVGGQLSILRVHAALAAFETSLRDLVPQVDAMFAALAAAAPQLQTAFALLESLPETATETREALTATNDRAATIEALLHELRFALNGPDAAADDAPR